MNGSSQGFVITAFWETNPGEEESVAALLRQFLPHAQKEEGVKEFQIHQNVSFAAHQQSAHFKQFIVGAAIPKLAKRERSQFQFI
jgi:hypothetical protein